jgi:putative membrane protein
VKQQSDFQFTFLLKSLILLGFSLVIFKLHYTGEISKLINDRYVALSLGAAIVFFFLFIVQLLRSISRWVQDEHEGCSHDHHGNDRHHHHSQHAEPTRPWLRVITYAVFCFPLLTGLLLPAQTLDASMAAKKGVQLAGGVSVKDQSKNQQKSTVDEQKNTNDPSNNTHNGSPSDSSNISDSSSDEGNAETDPTATEEIIYFDDLFEEKLAVLKTQEIIQLKDDNFIENYDAISFYPNELKGSTVELTGFVYREEGMTEDQLVVSRFIITHCVADAGVVGFLSEFSDASTFKNDTWIKVKGTLDVTKYGDIDIPSLQVKQWEIVEPPEDPYVYP